MSEWLLKQANYVPACIFIIFYFANDGHEINLFLATWSIVHVKGNEILEAIKGKES